MMRAQDFDSLNLALDDFRFPPVNLVAADSSGNVMYRLLGAVPVRSSGSP
ncbi:MAG: penicillin acylase family protein [Kofleriaceae bacterium]|nr:penicillin acylase family protein [Kofleriaceae bacterium]